MIGSDALAPFRPFVLNPLPATTAPWIAGVLGDHPSTYSRSPAMWNAAFAAFDLPAVYVAFDVAPDGLEAFLEACRTAPALLGLSVTIPYKERVAAYLDHPGPDVAAVGAVNTLIRATGGALTGTNTDGPAAVRALRPLMPAALSLGEARVLLLGAGGAARAIGAALAGTGSPPVGITLCARDRARADAAAQVIGRAGGNVTVVPMDDLEGLLPDTDALVNASPVGMTGPVRTESGVTWLEAFSPLAPAAPPSISQSSPPATPPAEWWERAWPDIARNLEVSLKRALRLRAEAAVLDLVYAPPDTVLLKHARWTGHPAANGSGMLVDQAVEAFMSVCRPLLSAGEVNAREKVTQAMTGAFR